MTRTVKAALLFFFLSLCASAVVVTHRVSLQAAPPAPHELFSIVEQQLAAFRVADYSSAYRHTASGVQQKFTVPQYEAMIRRDYGDLSGAQRIEFGSVKMHGSTAVVQVFFCSAHGVVRSFLYSFVAEDDSWKINGVQHLQFGTRPKGLHI